MAEPLNISKLFPSDKTLHARWSPTTFCVSCSCVTQQTFYCSVDWAFRTNRMTSTKCRLTYVISLCALGPNRKYTCENQDTRWTATTNLRSFTAVPLDFLKKKVESVFYMLQKRVQNGRSHGSVRTLAWCTNCSNIAFLAHTDINISYALPNYHVDLI